MAVNRFGEQVRERPPPADPLEPIRGLLKRLVDVLEALDVSPQVNVAVPDVHVDLGPVVAAVEAIADRIGELPAPQVTVESPAGGMDAGSLAVALAPLLQARPEWVDVLTDAIGKVQAPKVIGGSQTRVVEVMSRTEGQAIDPATSQKQDTSNATLSSIAGKLPDQAGTWAYHAGTAGTVIIPAGERVLQISAIAPGGSAGSVAINSGATITVPSGKAVTIAPQGNLDAPTIVFTGTAAYFVETVS